MSSIHILNNQRVRVGISVNPDPARRIVNLSLHGGSIAFNCDSIVVISRDAIVRSTAVHGCTLCITTPKGKRKA